MINQDMLERAVKLLGTSWDGSKTNQQVREIAKSQIAHYCDMLEAFAAKNPTTRLAVTLVQRSKELRSH